MFKVVWDERGVPRSPVFNDKYFCEHNGLADAEHIFCDGNRLRERFSALDPQQAGVFTIIETGFGTGLDFCMIWQIWDTEAPVSWRLRFVSIELYPLSKVDIGQALQVWPVLTRYREALLSVYDPAPPGRVLRAVLDDGRVSLDLVFDEVQIALSRIKDEGLAPQGADAFFLDGFAPSRNPGMWVPEIFAAAAGLSRAGTTFATFTAAGHVRRGLAAAGFSVRRPSGYAGKKDILTGVFD